MSSKTKSMAVREDAKPALVPKLRFPEFRGEEDWASNTLAEICHLITNGKANAQDHEADGEYPLFDRSALIKRSSVFMFDAEAVILPGEGMRFVPKYFCGKFNLHQRAYALMQHQGDGRFVYHSLDYLQDALAEKAVKSTVLSLRLPIVENFVIGYPSPAEQQKIAECLSSLDELMAAQARKVEALKEHKKGLMQQLFPREGESQPRLRFPEFRDAGEWTQDSIGNVCELLNHRRRPITSSQRTPGPYRYYGASGVVDYVEDYIFDERVVLVGEDGAKWGAFERTAFLVEGKFWVNNHAHVLNPHGVNDVLLENYLTMADLAPFVTGAAPPKLTLGKLKEIPVPIPPDEKEGETIATCLSSLDALITAETQKHEALRTHKRGLMQQLFPSPEEVGA
jgi:type I restriction enzyme S subunit